MAENSRIGWTDHTFNPWWGCEKVSDECRHCYIEAIMKRAGIRHPFDGPIRTKNWSAPLKWNRQAAQKAERHRVFTCSMSDFFHEGADKWRAECWELIRECSALDWLILTKRSSRIQECLPEDWGRGYPNVWLGVTCGHSSSYARIDDLLKVPAALKFVSAEPLLEPLDLRPYLHGIDWVVTGCEQAAKGKRRIMLLEWVREIDRQCRHSGTAHYFKQYYLEEKGTPVTDGMLDGVVRQEIPRTKQKKKPRHHRTRRHIEILKRLLKDDSFAKESERTRAWMRLTHRSRSRYFYYLPIALKELEDEYQNGRDVQSTACEKRDIARHHKSHSLTVASSTT